jgi:hypothetical protein
MKIITGRAISRRAMIRGVGSALALPFLDAMIPARLLGRQAAAVRPNRFQAFYVPNGMAMEYWTPSGQGRNFVAPHPGMLQEELKLTPLLETLAPYREYITQFSGLHGTWSALHAGASGSFLTGTPRGGRNEVEILADVSMDQLLARELGKHTQLASLEMSMDAPAMAGACTGALSCAYTSTISWRSATQPLPMEYNPRAVFERLFGDSGSTERAARERRLRQQRSILDSVWEEFESLNRDLGAPDRVRLEQYTEAVRDVERRIEMAEAQIDLELPVIDQPPGAPVDYEEHMALMQDLMVLALQTDLTRVITFMIAKEQSGRQYPESGVHEAHHPLSHHNDAPEMIDRLSMINRYHLGLFKNYLDKLSATPDVDGSLLDNMTVMYGAGISNSNAHASDNLPVLLVGHGAGRLKGGRHLSYADRPVLANLLVSIMDKFDVPVEHVGASTGVLPLEYERTGARLIEGLSGV